MNSLSKKSEKIISLIDLAYLIWDIGRKQADFQLLKLVVVSAMAKEVNKTVKGKKSKINTNNRSFLVDFTLSNLVILKRPWFHQLSLSKCLFF